MPRASSGQRGSSEISGMTTRCFVNAAVPQEPLLGPMGQGVIALANADGRWGPAIGSSWLPAGSIKQTNDVPEEWVSMAAHNSFRTSERSAPFAIISNVRFSAACNVAVRFARSSKWLIFRYGLRFSHENEAYPTAGRF